MVGEIISLKNLVLKTVSAITDIPIWVLRNMLWHFWGVLDNGRKVDPFECW